MQAHDPGQVILPTVPLTLTRGLSDRGRGGTGLSFWLQGQLGLLQDQVPGAEIEVAQRLASNASWDNWCFLLRQTLECDLEDFSVRSGLSLVFHLLYNSLSYPVHCFIII